MLTPPPKKLKFKDRTQNFWEDSPPICKSQEKKLKILKFSPQNLKFSKGWYFYPFLPNKEKFRKKVKDIDKTFRFFWKKMED